MAERTEERTRDREPRTDVDVEDLLDGIDDAGRSRESSAGADGRSGRSERRGLRAGLRERRRRLFSPRVFLGVLVLALAGGLLGGTVPLVGGFAGLVGVFGAAFVAGLASSGKHYLETGLAGATVAGVILLVTRLDIVFLTALRDVVPELGVIGAGAGALAALVGHYFGRDLRDGLTADL